MKVIKSELNGLCAKKNSYPQEVAFGRCFVTARRKTANYNREREAKQELSITQHDVLSRTDLNENVERATKKEVGLLSFYPNRSLSEEQIKEMFFQAWTIRKGFVQSVIQRAP